MDASIDQQQQYPNTFVTKMMVRNELLMERIATALERIADTIADELPSHPKPMPATTREPDGGVSFTEEAPPQFIPREALLDNLPKHTVPQ